MATLIVLVVAVGTVIASLMIARHERRRSREVAEAARAS